MVNLELYKVFYTVAKCGSLTKAAEDLYRQKGQDIEAAKASIKGTISQFPGNK